MRISRYIAVSVAFFVIGSEGYVLTMPSGYNSEELQSVSVNEEIEEINEQMVEEQKEENTYDVFITASNLRLRTEPSRSGEIIRTVPAGTIVEILNVTGDWYSVHINDETGYMYSAYIINLTVLRERTGHYGYVENLHWRYVRNILPQNTPVMITDVRTGKTYWIISFSHGNHADVYTLTAEDTAIFHSTFGGRWTWDTRPILVHTENRILAASINGMPHGAATQRNYNNMFGHVCIHFYGSRTHNGNRFHENDHQSSVREALRVSN